MLAGAGSAFFIAPASKGVSAIDQKYNEPGIAALLGAPTGNERAACKNNVPAGRVRTYTNGNIYSSKAGGAHEVHGAILTRYLGFGGPCGKARFPTSDELTGPVAGEKLSTFQKANIYWHNSLGAHLVHGRILEKYVSLGGDTSFLGLPTTDDLASSSTKNKVTEFQNGHIYSSAKSGAHPVRGAILTKYVAAGAFNGPDGFPIGDEITLNTAFAAGGRAGPLGGVDLGLAQEFQRGNIYSSGAAGTHVVRGVILKKYLAMGGVYSWGRPLTDHVSGSPNVQWVSFEGSGPGNPLRIFQHGVTPNIKAHEINGAILMKFDAMGGEPVFGSPLSDETNGKCFAQTGAKFSLFKRHAIVWTGATGAHELHNNVGAPSGEGILSKWNELGRDCGPVTVPTTDVNSLPNGASSADFVGGAIVVGPFGTFEVHGPIFERWNGYSRQDGVLGFPKSDVRSAPNGGNQTHFGGGSIYYHADTGAWDVQGGHDTKYRSMGGPSSFLGYPLFPGTTAFGDGALFGGNSGKVTEFQHGTIVHNTWTVPVYMRGKIRDRWEGETDAQHQITGYPVSDPFPTGGGGVFQQFLNPNGIPGGPKGTFMILNPHDDTVWKIQGTVLECYASGPPHAQGSYWDSPMGFPTSDTFPSGGNTESAFFENGPDGRGNGFIRSTTISRNCEYGHA
ncbi:MAG: hypothetical protein WD826_04295 [Actinomycetota bacterium]